MKTAMLIILAAIPVVAQTHGPATQDHSLSCNDRSYSRNNQVTHCEIREQTIGYGGRLSVDAGMNGGVSVKAWDNATVLVRAKVESSAEDELTAASLASQVRVDVSAGQVSASGPESQKNRGWSVSYEVMVPRRADLSLKTNNGGISIADVRGNIQFAAQNGGVTLKRLGGDVQGSTMNGGLTIELNGDRWDGTKLDARTTNGGVNLTMPERYSAHFETATVNGHLNVNYPMTVRGELTQRLSTDLGSGGPTIHVETTNGGVNLKKAAI